MRSDGCMGGNVRSEKCWGLRIRKLDVLELFVQGWECGAVGGGTGSVGLWLLGLWK